MIANWLKSKITYKYKISMMHMIWSIPTNISYINHLRKIDIEMIKVIKTIIEYEVSLNGLFQDNVMDKF
jgi:hypothetical protein